MTERDDQKETKQQHSDLDKLNQRTSTKEAYEIRLDLERTYIDGKMRRFYLLFAVNGGAFAIVQLAKCSNSLTFIGNLNMNIIASGAILFTALMFIDLWGYARGIRRMEARWIRQGVVDSSDQSGPRTFSVYGKLILTGMWALLAGGWLLAAGGEPWQLRTPSQVFLALSAMFNIVTAALMLLFWWRNH